MRHVRSLTGLLWWLALSFAAGTIGARFSPGDWYQGLAKPGWTPPDGVFPPVWTALYALMGIAAWLVWRRTGLAGGALPLGIFALQLILNVLWSWLFFGLHRPGAAFFEIILLWCAILATAAAFLGHSRAAGALLLPYLAWVGFASLLNFAVWRLNP